MSLLTPEPGLLFWMLISFGITVFILARFGFPVILKSVEKRKNYIEESLLAAKKAHEELAGIKEIGEAMLSEARKTQADILKDTSLQRDKIIEKAHDEAKAETVKLLDAARRQIVDEKEEALRNIRTEVAALSVSLAESILKEKLGSEQMQQQMIERLLHEIDLSKS